MDLKSEIVVSMGLTVKGVDYMYKRDEVRVPFEIDPASTAVEGEHYEIVGGGRELVLGIMKATADVTIRFLKKEAGKDKVIIRLVEGGLFEGGTNASVTVNVNGPTLYEERGFPRRLSVETLLREWYGDILQTVIIFR